VPSMGSVGDCYDNAMIEAFWSRMQVELLDRQRWKTRIELANAILEYLEVFHNRSRRHQQPGHAHPTRVRAHLHRGMRIQPHGSTKPGAHQSVQGTGCCSHAIDVRVVHDALQHLTSHTPPR
jgi:hypothetical protein